MTERSESQLQDELQALIRALYRSEEAADIIETFAATMRAHQSEDMRIGILAHWIEYYALKKYKRDRQRRRPTYSERTTACAACGYPASHRHHVYDVGTHGENIMTVQLCANCHELQHLMYNALVNESEYSLKLINHILYSERLAVQTAVTLLNYCRATIRYEARQGWVSAEKASDDWVEMQLHWREYLKQQRARA
jgi:ribosomal protein L37E